MRFIAKAALLVLTAAAPAAAQSDRWETPAPLVPYRAAPVAASPSAAPPLFRLYRFVIADQDGDVCPFRPSCSAFTQAAIARKGWIVGGLMGADRLVRDTNPLKSARAYGLVRDGAGVYLSDPVADREP